jgi:dipeptidyl aminopeptidase/acylaminoacyl peptidase
VTPVFRSLLGLALGISISAQISSAASLATKSTQAPRVRPAFSIDQSLSFQTPSAPQISPNGRFVVYQVSRTDWEDNAFESDLWVVSVDHPAARTLLTEGNGWNGWARWSPDGEWIAFLSDRDGQKQLYVVPAKGSPAREVTHSDSGVNDFRWSPNSHSIAFTTDQDERKSNSGRNDRYGDFEIVEDRANASTLWRVDLHTATDHSANITADTPVALTRAGKYGIGGFSWSPDGARIAFEGEPRGSNGREGIYILTVAARTAAPLTTTPGPYRNPVWSPDGESIAFETAGGDPNYYYANWSLAKISAAGGAIEPLTKSFDENADLLAWTSRGIFFGAFQRTASHLFAVDPGTKTIRVLTEPAGSVNLQFSVSADGSRFAWLRGAAAAFAEIYASGTDRFGPIRLTEANDQAPGFEFARQEVIRWKSSDGTEIEGILEKPADFDPHKRYPLLVVIHGGPVAVDQPMMRPDRTYPIEQFVESGALVLRPNYRGSAGYGAKMRALPVRNLGIGDAADIVSGVDALIAKGFVDPSRLGAMGWSEGGYISAFLGTYTDRFRAVSVGAGISDWLTYYVNTDITPFTRQYLKATPWADPEAYRRASPITYINRAKTPMLIQHGDEDKRVPIPNAYELRQALEDRHVPVRMIVYKGFGHAIDRPKQQRAVMEHNLEWFREWIFDSKPDGDPDSVQFARDSNRRPEDQ